MLEKFESKNKLSIKKSHMHFMSIKSFSIYKIGLIITVILNLKRMQQQKHKISTLITCFIKLSKHIRWFQVKLNYY